MAINAGVDSIEHVEAKMNTFPPVIADKGRAAVGPHGVNARIRCS